MQRTGIKPGFRIGTLLPVGRATLRRVFPFRKSWIAIGVLAVMDVVFLLPAVATFRQAAGEWARFESLFDLVAAVFLSAWLLGWSMAPLLMTGILLMMLFGREVLTVRPGRVELAMGLPLLGLTAIYDVAKMRNLRWAEPPPKSGTAWRGPHLAFDYGANTTEFGSAIDAATAAALIRSIETAARTAIRTGVGAEGATSGGDLADVWALFADLWPALLALFLSHGYSFVVNFLGRQEYRRRTVSDQMGDPYSRVIFMHLVLIFGGGLSLLLGGPTLVLIAVIALKVFFDLRAHIKQHGGKNKKPGSE